VPQAPLSPVVDSSSGGTPNVGVSAPVEAFGGAVGHALSSLGDQVHRSSDQLWQRAVEMQNLENETNAKRADTEYMTKAGMLHAEFSSLEGLAAKQAYPQYIKNLQDSRTAIRGSLNNPMAQKMYDASSMNFMGRSIFNGAGHAATQAKVASVNASKSRVQSLTDNIGANPYDEEGFQRSVKSIQAETRSQGAQGGWSEDQVKATSDANVSSAVATRITSVARSDPFGAQWMYDNALKIKAMTPVDASRTLASIQTQSRQAIPRGISSEVNADLEHPAQEGIPEKSLEDRIAEAQDKAESYAKNDPLLPDFVKQRVIADYNRSKAIQRDATQRNEQTIAGALMTGNKEGILPKSVDELKLINPAVSAAWDSLKPTTQKKYMAAMAHNANGDKVAWTNETLANYQKLKGMAEADPVEFLAKDIISENMPASGKRTLINEQIRRRSQSESDPRVGRALQILSPDIQAAGISKKSDIDQYYRFTGGLADALDAYQKDHKKVPTADEVRKIGAQLMQQQVIDKGWLWDSKSATFDLPIPEERAKEIKADPYWAKNNITPNDAMIRRIHAAQEYKRLYGGSVGKPETQFPPNAPTSQ
jgi:hypothetical protein